MASIVSTSSPAFAATGDDVSPSFIAAVHDLFVFLQRRVFCGTIAFAMPYDCERWLPRRINTASCMLPEVLCHGTLLCQRVTAEHAALPPHQRHKADELSVHIEDGTKPVKAAAIRVVRGICMRMLCEYVLTGHSRQVYENAAEAAKAADASELLRRCPALSTLLHEAAAAHTWLRIVWDACNRLVWWDCEMLETALRVPPRILWHTLRPPAYVAEHIVHACATESCFRHIDSARDNLRVVLTWCVCFPDIVPRRKLLAALAVCIVVPIRSHAFAPLVDILGANFAEICHPPTLRRVCALLENVGEEPRLALVPALETGFLTPDEWPLVLDALGPAAAHVHQRIVCAGLRRGGWRRRLDGVAAFAQRRVRSHNT